MQDLASKSATSESPSVQNRLTISLILAINQIALAEGLSLGESLGLDQTVLSDVINTSSGMFQALAKLTTGQSWSSTVNSPLKTAENGYEPGFAASLMLKVRVR